MITAAAVLAVIESSMRVGRRLAGGVTLISWIIVAAFGVRILIASANAKFGFFMISIASASGVALLRWLWRRTPDIVIGASPVIGVTFPSILLSGHFNDYGEVPVSSFILLILAPISVWAGVPLFKHRPLLASIASLAAVATICGIALGLAWPAMSVESTGY
jgi:hypothetical protein